jgi:hypothetical protein
MIQRIYDTMERMNSCDSSIKKAAWIAVFMTANQMVGGAFGYEAQNEVPVLDGPAQIERLVEEVK